MKSALKGLGVAMITPFAENASIDYTALERLVKHLHKGADYLVVMGTTAESPTLSEEEQIAVLEFVLEVNKSVLPVVFGLGGNDTQRVARRMADWKHDEVAAFLSVSPYYNRPGQEGIFQHYKRLCELSPKPVIAYNVPARTGSNILPDTCLRMAEELTALIGVKEAAGSMEQVMALASRLPDDFLLIGGDDALAFPHMSCGGHGIISVVGNAFPQTFGEMIRLCLSANFEAARALHYKLLPLMNALFTEGNPAGIKEVLSHLRICEQHLRLPLLPVSKALSDQLYRLTAELEDGA